MKLVELFCGTGGFSRGAHSAGFKVAAAYDIDPILTSSYERNFPGTSLFHRDIAELSGEAILRDVGESVFGLFGGPPCQGFSDIGKRDPNDPRRELLGHFFRIVAELRPVFFVMENVRGLGHKGARPVLDAGLAQIARDYDFDVPEVWDAADFGAATKRKRLLVIGIRKDIGRPFYNRQLKAKYAPAATVYDAISDLALAKEICPSSEGSAFDRWQLSKSAKASEYAKLMRADDLTFTGHRKTAHTAKVAERFQRVSPGSIDTVGRHQRLSLDGQCPTLRAGTGSDLGSFQSVRPIHPVEPRVITVREAARLQGFPDSHLFHPTVWHSFRMIGNSVSPVMASAVFVALKDHLQTVAEACSSSSPTRPAASLRPAA